LSLSRSRWFLKSGLSFQLTIGFVSFRLGSLHREAFFGTISPCAAIDHDAVQEQQWAYRNQQKCQWVHGPPFRAHLRPYARTCEPGRGVPPWISPGITPPLLVWASPMREPQVTQFYVMARDDQSWVSLLSCRRKQADGRGQHSLCPPCPLVCVSLASYLGFARSYGLTIKNIADTSKAKVVSSSGPLLSTTFANGFHIVPLSVRPGWLQGRGHSPA